MGVRALSCHSRSCPQVVIPEVPRPVIPEVAPKLSFPKLVIGNPFPFYKGVSALADGVLLDSCLSLPLQALSRGRNDRQE